MALALVGPTGVIRMCRFALGDSERSAGRIRRGRCDRPVRHRDAQANDVAEPPCPDQFLQITKLKLGRVKVTSG